MNDEIKNQTPNLPDSTDENTVEKKPETFSLGGGGGKTSKGGILDRLLNKSPSAGTLADSGKLPDLNEILKTPAPTGPASSGGSISQLLGPQPIFNKAVYQEAYRKKLKLTQSIFYGAFLIAILVFGFFYVQLNSNITALNDLMGGPNTASSFERSNAEVKNKQTEINLVRYRYIRLLLDDVNLSIDPYLKAVHDIPVIETTRVADSLATVIRERLKEIQKQFNENLSIPLITTKPVTFEEREAEFAQLLKDNLIEQKRSLTDQKEPNTDEIRIVENVLRLIENDNLKNALSDKQIDKLSHDELAQLLSTIRADGTDELSSIQKIKLQRLDWAKLIQDIHAIVRKADTYYGQGLFKSVGGFLFSSYRFDAATNRISISGLTKTPNNRTFSFITQLIDAIEKSSKFKDIDFRSFSKTRDDKGDYTSGIDLEFAIQTGSDPRDEEVK
ncbi:hypothetical protein KBD59_03275 [Candidatus Gracilibacteria bacterium]|nr:hypothetical protein [Candidatus Gracilibacteria bacterium]